MLCTIPLANHRALYGNQQTRDSKLLQAVGFRVRNWQQQNPEACVPWDLNLFNDHELFTLRKLDQSDDEDFNFITTGKFGGTCFGFLLYVFGRIWASFVGFIPGHFWGDVGFLHRQMSTWDTRTWNLGRNQKHVMSWGVGFAISLLLGFNLAFNYA